MSRIFFAMILFISNMAFGQLKEKGDTIYTWEGNNKFVRYIDSLFQNFVNTRADSLMLIYEPEDFNNALLVVKKEGKACSFFISPKFLTDEIGLTLIRNNSISSVGLNKIYGLLSQNDIKVMDTSHYASHNGYHYCRFYISKTITTFGGWHDSFRALLSHPYDDFFEQLANERYLIISSNFPKNN